jgi:hypothetical protein
MSGLVKVEMRSMGWLGGRPLLWEELRLVDCLMLFGVECWWRAAEWQKSDGEKNQISGEL